MKTLFVAALLLTSGLAHAEPAQKLSGNYLFTNDACLPFNKAAGPHYLTIVADDQQIQLELPTQFQGNPSSMIADTLYVGDSTNDMLGGSQYRMLGAYSADGNSFKYQEFDSEIPHGPLSLLRTKTLQLTGNKLVIVYAEEGLPKEICEAVRQ